MSWSTIAGVERPGRGSDRRDRGPDDLQARVAVDRRAVEVLLARPHPELQDAEQDDDRDRHEDRDRDDDAGRPRGVDRPACVEAACGNQWIGRPAAMPIAEAMTPNDDPAGRWCARLVLRRDVLAACGAILWGRRRRTATQLSAPCCGDRSAAARRSAVRRASRAQAASDRGVRGSGACAERRRREPVVAPERLRELRGLAVADALGDLADGQAARRSSSAARSIRTRGEVLAERRVADLGVGALELAARGRDAPRDVVERQIGAVLGLDDRDGIPNRLVRWRTVAGR